MCCGFVTSFWSGGRNGPVLREPENDQSVAKTNSVHASAAMNQKLRSGI